MGINYDFEAKFLTDDELREGISNCDLLISKPSLRGVHDELRKNKAALQRELSRREAMEG